jgi:syntaxin 5
MAMTTSIQDRTGEFRSILQQAQRRNNTSKIGGQRQSLLTSSEKQAANGTTDAQKRSEFARRAADIGRGISGTMAKLERLSQLAKRKTLFDDRPVEINELTFVIKQDVAALTQSISQLEQLSRQQHPNARPGGGDQEGEHNISVVSMLKGKLKDVGVDFKEVLEVRTKNIQASRSRTENFISSVSAHSNQSSLDPSRTDSPLYQTPNRGPSPKPGYTQTNAAQSDLLSLDPSSSSSALARVGPQSDQQLLMMEEAQPQNTYIQQRGEAIETIERTIAELGGIFGQLAQMVSEQGEMVERIDANTEDVVDNVEGAQRELLKYWGRVQGNRWLVAKMFGVLMICEHAHYPLRNQEPANPSCSLLALGFDRGLDLPTFLHGRAFCSCID